MFWGTKLNNPLRWRTIHKYLASSKNCFYLEPRLEQGGLLMICRCQWVMSISYLPSSSWWGRWRAGWRWGWWRWWREWCRRWPRVSRGGGCCCWWWPWAWRGGWGRCWRSTLDPELQSHHQPTDWSTMKYSDESCVSRLAIIEWFLRILSLLNNCESLSCDREEYCKILAEEKHYNPG